MANCRACGGRLGLDCFNEADCLQISMNEQYSDSYNNSELEHYISILIYTMVQKGITIPNSFAAEPPLIFKIVNTCDTNPNIDYDLPW